MAVVGAVVVVGSVDVVVVADVVVVVIVAGFGVFVQGLVRLLLLLWFAPFCN